MNNDLNQNKEIKGCNECESEYYADTSKMKHLCPNCSHFLYGYANCDHRMEHGRCTKCYWNGNTTEYIKGLKQ